MAELRNLSWYEKLKSYVLTARETPLKDAFDTPAHALSNAILKQVPLPWDIPVAVDTARQLIDQPILALPLAAGVAKSVADDPLAASMGILSAKAPLAAVNAYRELTPMHVRAYLHQFYGGGEPMTYMRKGLREPAMVGATDQWIAHELFAKERQTNNAFAALSRQEAREIRTDIATLKRQWPNMSEDARTLRKMRDAGYIGPEQGPELVKAKEWMKADNLLSDPLKLLKARLHQASRAGRRKQHWSFNDSEAASAAVALEMRGDEFWPGTIGTAPARSVYTKTQNILESPFSPASYPQKIEDELTQTLGKTYVTLSPKGTVTGIKDLYKFWPGAYKFPNPPDEFYSPAAIAGEGITHLFDSISEKISGGNTTSYRGTLGGRIMVEGMQEGGNASTNNLFNFWHFQLPRRIAIGYGTPYEMDIPLPSGVGKPTGLDRFANYTGSAALAAEGAQHLDLDGKLRQLFGLNK